MKVLLSAQDHTSNKTPAVHVWKHDFLKTMFLFHVSKNQHNHCHGHQRQSLMLLLVIQLVIQPLIFLLIGALTACQSLFVRLSINGNYSMLPLHPSECLCCVAQSIHEKTQSLNCCFKNQACVGTAKAHLRKTLKKNFVTQYF